MNNKALIIYDNTGFIYNITYNTDKVELPILSSMIIDVPEGKNINSIDVSTNTPIYDDIPQTEMADIKNSVDVMNSRIDSIMNMLNVLTAVTMGGLHDGQIPADQFEENPNGSEDNETVSENKNDEESLLGE